MTVLYAVDGAVATVTLNRPERLNAWTAEMEEEYAAALDEATADGDVRAAVVTGAGRGYSAGWDMDELRTVSASSRAGSGGASLAVTATLRFPKPLVAAINGSCAGLGLAHALACDIRFAAAGVKLTTSYARLGLVAEDGTSWLLPHVVGLAAALDLLLSARVVLAEEALALGLVNRVLPREELLSAALAYARDVAENCSPHAVAAMKTQVRRHTVADLESALAESAELVGPALAHTDFAEGVASFTERRLPRFAPWT